MSSVSNEVIDERYKKGYIYYLYDRKNNRIYVGCSRTSFSKRISDHKYDYKAYMGDRNPKVERNYRTSFDILIQEEYETGILEHFPCNSKKELEYREYEWITALSQKKGLEVVNIWKRKVKTPQLDHSFFQLPFDKEAS